MDNIFSEILKEHRAIIKRKVKTWQLLETAKILIEYIIKYAEGHNIPLDNTETLTRLPKEVDRLLYDSKIKPPNFQHRFRTPKDSIESLRDMFLSLNF